MKSLIETMFKRLKKHFQNNDCAFISACRSENTPEENNKATLKLAFDLQYLGYGFIKIKGGYVENKDTLNEKAVEEKSFAVFNNNDPKKYRTNFKRDMIVLCRKYKQECVLIKMKNEPGHLYFQDGSFKDNYNITKDIIENTYSRLRNTKFSLIEADESDEKENYNMGSKSFWSFFARGKSLKDYKNQYPDLFENTDDFMPIIL